MSIDLRHGDALELARELEPESIHAVICSPPYGHARTYGDDTDARQLGREQLHPLSWAALLADVFATLVRALTPDGALVVNLGDTFAGGGYGASSKLARKRKSWAGTMADDHRRAAPYGYDEGDLVLLGPLLIDAIRARAPLWLRAEIIWAKPTGGEPATIRDRPPKRHEKIFILSKTKQSRLRDPGGADTSWWRSDVWTFAASGGRSHNPSTAAMPEELARRLVVCSTRPGETVLDPFAGGSTTLLAADRLGRSAIGFEIEEDLVVAARRRLYLDAPLFHGEQLNGVVHDDPKEVITKP